jgi:NitT/TauT family transport system substrate-binding protein
VEKALSRRLIPAVLLSACSRRKPAVRIVVGGQTDLVYLPTTLAYQRGDFETEGVPVEIEDTGAGSKSLQALLGGSAQVVTGFYDHAVQMAAEGRPVKAFVTLTRYPGAVLLASPEGAKRFRRIQDLRGATVGVTAPGSSSHFFVNHLLIRNGLSPSDVSVVAMGGGRSRVAAIENSKVDAGVLFEPGVSFLLRRTGEARILADTRTQEGVQSIFGTAEYPAAVLYAKADWLSANSDMARRLVRAMRGALRWIQEHSPEEIAERMPASFRQEEPAAYTEALRRSRSMYSPDGVMRREAAEAVKRVLALSLEKVRHADVDVAKTYTNEFVEGE